MTENEEVWKPVRGYEGQYEVCPGTDKHPEGQVRSLDREVSTGLRHNAKVIRKGKRIKVELLPSGYAYVVLSSYNKPKLKLMHRIIMEAFTPNPDNLPQVNHKDECRTNNRLENLEWCDSKHNINYGTALHRRALKRGKPVGQYDKTGKRLAIYYSTAEAARESGVGQGNISNVCCGKQQSAGGFIWKYME